MSEKKKAQEETKPLAPFVEESVLDTILGYTLKRAYLAIHDDYKANQDDIGLSQREFSALSIILDNQDINQTDLGRAMSIERANMVVLVDQLEGKELITRNKVPTDRRSYALRATLKGRRACEKAVSAIRDHENRVLHDLSEGERADLLRLLRQVVESAKTANR